MHFLIFIPDAKPSELDAIAKTSGLSDLLGGHDALPNAVGPESQTGLMLGWLSPANPRMHYEPSQQDWQPSVAKTDTGRPRYWVGIWKDHPPTESELRRNYTQDGPRVKFGQCTWKLPTPATVDARAVYEDDGSMRWEVVRQYSWVCDEADAVREKYLEDFGLRQVMFAVNPKEQVDWLLKLLRINYRITPEVAVYLDLWIGQRHLIDVVLATLKLTRTGGDSDGQ